MTDKKKKQSKEEEKKQDEMAKIVKELEGILFSIKFYPVAVKIEDKEAAVKKLNNIYKKGDETVRQLVLYMIHENMAASAELKIMHSYEYFKMRKQNLESAQVRMNVYRSMFNYNTSVEGLIEFIRILAGFDNGDDSIKVLTYHYSYLCTMESEANHMLRNAILESLGNSNSLYALKVLLEYARYTDNERSMQRIFKSLVKWKEKLETLKTDAKTKKELEQNLKDVMSKEFGDTHYG